MCNLRWTEAAARKCSSKKVFLISWYSKQNTCVFLWTLRNFQEQLFLWSTPSGCSWMARNNFAGCHDAKKQTNTYWSDYAQERHFNQWCWRNVVFMGVVSSCKSSHREVICEKGILKKFTKFTKKYQCWSLFLIKFKGLKRDPSIGVFLLILPYFQNICDRLLLEL